AGVGPTVPGDCHRRAVGEGVELLDASRARRPEEGTLAWLRRGIERAVGAQEGLGSAPAVTDPALPALLHAPRTEVEAPGAQADPDRGSIRGRVGAEEQVRDALPLDLRPVFAHELDAPGVGGAEVVDRLALPV